MNALRALADALPQVQWTITTGQLALAGSFLILAWRLSLIHKAMIVFIAEHDYVLDWLSEFLEKPRHELTQLAVVRSGQKSKSAKVGS